MTTEITQSTSRKTLKNLVEVLLDGQKGFQQSAENVKSPELKELFSRYSLQRSKFAGELENQLLSLGEEDPQDEKGSFSGAAHRGWINLKAALTTQDDHAVLAEAERGEDVAKKAYKEALTESKLSAPVRDIVTTQAMAIQAAHDQVKALRDAAAAK